MGTKVSVIIPMYNCASYLPELFQAFRNQSLKDFELICVIDGATDETEALVRSYAAEDRRIRCFCKENGGAGSARNAGLKHADGEYLVFVDADDQYSEGYLKEMADAADSSHADVVLCQYELHDYTTGITAKDRGFNRDFFPDRKPVDPRGIPNLFQCVTTGPTNKLFRRAMIEEDGLRFSETHVANDVFFVLASLSAAKQAVGIHQNLLHVRQRHNANSITSRRAEYTEEMVTGYRQLYRWLEAQALSEPLRDTFCTAFLNSLSYNASFGVNPRLIEAASRFLNEEAPWKDLNQDELYAVAGRCIDTAFIRKNIRNLERAIQRAEGKPQPQ